MAKWILTIEFDDPHGYFVDGDEVANWAEARIDGYRSAGDERDRVHLQTVSVLPYVESGVAGCAVGRVHRSRQDDIRCGNPACRELY